MVDLPDSAGISVSSTGIGSTLKELLFHDELKPGDEPSYQMCKAIYLFHPLGSKIAEMPIRLAMEQERDLTALEPIKEQLLDAFRDEWKRLGIFDIIVNLHTQARIYGLANVGMGEGATEDDQSQPIDLDNLWKSKIWFNVWDPLNTSGLIVDQDPNSPTFQKHREVSVAGRLWHRSRTLTVQNEFPIYIAWTSSSYSYAGRSAYQRAFYPLKSFLNSMTADDMVARKVALIVAHLEQPGSIVNRVWKSVVGFKRALLREARNDNVLSVGIEEQIETLNLRNVNAAMEESRENILKNIASGVPMPAKLLTQEAFVKGFGEGTQDAAEIAKYVDGIRIQMDPTFEYFDEVVCRRAWNPEFFETIQRQHPEKHPNGYGDVDYKQAFYEWRRSFKPTWPNLLKEPESELVQVDDVRMKAVIALAQVLEPMLDPENKVKVLQFVENATSIREELFGGNQLQLNFDSLRTWLEKQEQQAEMMQQAGGAEGGSLAEEERSAKPPPPFSAHDTATAGVGLVELVRERDRRVLRS